jgi:cytochrome b
VNRVLVWDLPTRVFHWTLAASFFTALASGDSDRYRDVHIASGYIVLGLLAFRLAWGFAGSRYARFGSFAYGVTAVAWYVRDLMHGSARRYLGHNPPGGWSIFAMLTLAAVVCVTGIAVWGAEESHGALAGFGTHRMGELTKALHETLSWLMFALVAAHVAGVLVESRAHHENLAGAMVTGYKAGGAGEGINASHRAVAFLLLLAVAVGLAWLLAGRFAPGVHIPFVGRNLPDNAVWRSECGSCHTAFHPTLLPARSWKALMDRQADHFGENLALAPDTAAEITAFLQKNAAETGMTEAAYKINRSIPAHATPLRITDTGYWIEKHRGIEEGVWTHPKVGSRSNCGGCHQDAQRGTYEDAAMRLPR